MNITELKALAEKATQGDWEAAGPSFGDLLPRYCNEVLAISEGDEETQVCRYPDGLECECTDDMKYIAAANPAAILELIAQLEDAQKCGNWAACCFKESKIESLESQLEDAQGENRALLVNEQNLRERVKELEEGLRSADKNLSRCLDAWEVPRNEIRALLEKQK